MLSLVLVLLVGCTQLPSVNSYQIVTPCIDNPHVRCIMSIEATHGKVVDSRSGEPLEGVIVMGYWPKMMRDPHWRATVGVAHLAETLSSSSGFFEIPACDPACEVDGYFAYYHPDILFFKEGYYPKVLSNPITDVAFDPDSSEHMRWRWDWNDEVIELEPISDKKNDPRLKAAFTLSPRLYLNDNCNWMKIPNTLMFKTRQMQLRERNKEKAVMPASEYLAGFYLKKQKKCHPDPASYLKEAVRYEQE